MHSTAADVTGFVPSLLLDQKARAKLRRMDPYEVREAYAWVARAKASGSLGKASDGALMAVTPLVAEVRQDTKQSLGEALRGVSERRVRRLLASDREDIVDQLRKAVRLVGRAVSIEDLAATAVFWGEQRRRALARAYFSQGDEDDAPQE